MRADTISQIIELLIPESFPAMEADRKARFVEDSARDLLEIVDRMPSHLRIGFGIALLLFTFSSIPVNGRLFGGLSRDKQQIHLAAWTDSRLGLMRDFMKLIRNLALFHFYDHPEMRLDGDRIAD